MIELLNHTVLWWHWIVIGLVLIIAEMSTGTFITLGLGISAIAVGLIDLIVPMGFTIQLLVWIILSIILVTAFFKWFKTQPTVSNSGQSSYRFDTPGTVIEKIHPHKRGKVTFDAPVLGNTDWHATSSHELSKGDRVKIIEVNGQLIKVAPINS
jgi:membrane protein implicated in regulation of membrane protease activity